MAFVVKDRVKQSTTTTGTGSIVLNGTVSGFQTFANALSDGDTTYYAIFEVSTNEWEVGVGTWTESTTTLARTTVLASSNSNSAIDLSAQAEVFITQPAGKAAFFDPSGDLTLVQDPTSNLQAATKQYVDTIAAAGLHYHDPVRVEQEGNLSATYSNGTAGVGATLTNNSTQAALTIDGVALSLNDRVLIYEQTNGYENGIYTVTNVGSASTNWVLTRATDADSYAPSDPDSLGQGDAFFVLEGAAGAGELYVMNTSGTITFGTTNITFTQVASTAVYSAGTGLTLTGTEFSADGANITNVDAVTLDGIDSSQFLRSDVVDTKTAGNLNFSDNVKAVFGDGSDLEIYHSGAASVIHDNGTGNLELRAGSFRLKNGANTAFLMKADVGGAASLFHNGSEKFATTSTGIDVTGRITTDAITEDTSGNVGIGATSPAANLDVVGTTAGSGTAETVFRLAQPASTLSAYNEIRSGVTSGTDPYLAFAVREANTPWNTVERMIIDSNGRVGIGTSSPTNALTAMSGSSNTAVATFGGINTSRGLVISTNTGGGLNEAGVDFDAQTATYGQLSFSIAGSEAMRIISNGTLLVGKTSEDNTTQGIRLYGANGFMSVVRDGDLPMALYRKTSDGEILRFSKNSTTVGTIGVKYSDDFYIAGNSSHSGLGFGTTSIYPTGHDGTANDNVDDLGQVTQRFKDLYLAGQARVGTGGRTRFQAAGIYDDSTNGNNVGIFFGGGQYIGPLNGSGNAVDNLVDIGSSSYRFQNLYLSSTPYITHNADNAGAKLSFQSLHTSNNTIEIHQFGQSHANAPAVNQIGVSNAEQHLHLVTDASATVDAGTSTKGIFLRSGGNVGIGTQSPSSILHVNGGSGGWGIFERNSKQLYVNANWGAQNNYAQIAPRGTDNMGLSLSSSDNDPEYMFINTSGNVGIGTTSPGEKLDVVGDARIRGSGSTMAGATMANASLLVGSTTSGIGIDSNEIVAAGDSLYLGSLTNGVIFRVGSTQHGAMDSSGNFGFGTTSPSQKLHVQGGQVRVSNGSDFYINSTSSNSYVYTSSTPFDIYTAGTMRMRVGSTGDVSIGNNAAFTVGGSAKLTVLGASGTVYLAGGSANGDQFYLRKNASVSGMYEWQTYYSSNNQGTIQLQPYGGSVTIGGSNATTTKKLEVFGDIGSTGLSVIPTGAVGGAYFGNATQTSYMNLIITSNSGNAQIWKSGTGYSGYGGTSSLNIYNSNANIAFFSNARTTADMNITNGNVSVAGALTATSKSFVIDHPTKEGMKLRHGSLEGPEDGVYVRGRLTGETVIELPDYWTGLVHEDSITVQLTAMGGKADLWVESIADNKVTVGCDTEVDCFYFVQATRKDVDAWDVEYVADS